MQHAAHHHHAAAAVVTVSPRAYARPAVAGVLASATLLALYFGILTLVSGWEFTLAEFGRYWIFIVALALAFGLQVALFLRLRTLATGTRESGAVVAASGTTSTAAMVSCCAHYLANAVPVLGATGLVAFAAQFQVELFWVGLACAAAGIAFVLGRLVKAEKEHAQCAA